MATNGPTGEGRYERTAPGVWKNPRPAKGGGSILFVDDEDFVRQCASDILEGEGFCVVALGDAELAVEYYREHRDEIALVFMDICMPRMTGDEAFLKILHLDPDAKVCLISGYSPEGVVAECLNQGAAGFLRKPFGIEDLVGIATEALARG